MLTRVRAPGPRAPSPRVPRSSNALRSTVTQAGYVPAAGVGLVRVWGLNATVARVELDGAAVPFTQDGTSALAVTIPSPRTLLTPFVLTWA